MKITKPTTYSIDVQHRFIAYLKEYAPKYTLFKSVSTEDIIKYVTSLSKAEADLWEQVRITYPESVGKKVLTVSNTEISWEDQTPLS